MLLEAKGLSKHFGGILAVSAVSLSVSRSSIVAVIGPNGAGKTTFFNMVTGVYPSDSGSLTLDGVSLLGCSTDEIARKGIGRTFQTIRLFRGMTVLENVLVPQAMRVPKGWSALIRSTSYRKAERAAIELAYDCLDRVGLSDHAGQAAGNLSYGQQRRLEVARALALNPCVLLLDEPAAGMNAQEKDQMIELIRNIRSSLGVAIVLIEHDMDMVAKLAERVTVLHHGEVLAEGTPEDIRSNSEVISAYLGEAI